MGDRRFSGRGNHVSRTSFYISLALLLTLLAVAQPLTIGAQSASVPWPPAPDPLSSYRVRLADQDMLVLADAPPAELADVARRRQREEIDASLKKLAAAGLAGDYSFEEAEQAFRVQLTDSGRASLSANQYVASVEPYSHPRSPKAAPADDTLAPAAIRPLGVSSIIFAQVYSPFVWGRTNIGGLTVELTLEDSSGSVKGVPSQKFRTTDKYVKIDRVQLYFETVFVNPDVLSHPPVTILPGDRIHVVTSGDDPGTPGVDPPEDKRISVDDIRAWTSYERDGVGGTAPANSSLVVTVGTSPSLAQYLTPGAAVTYAEVISESDRSFFVSSFRTSTDATPKKSDLKQGASGFVRLRHPDGNEVYTVHGQNVIILQNSPVLHGYAAKLPSAPGSLESGVAVTRTVPSVSVTLKDASGVVKDTLSGSAAWPYTANFAGSTISGGDMVEVSIGNAPATQTMVGTVTATPDLGANEVAGSGPGNTQMVIGAGRINGYVAKNSTFNYIEKRVSTDSGGRYASGPFQCGASNLLDLRHGSFGYVGYEEERGNFIYVSYAAPANHVMADYPFMEGWTASGMVRPDITVRDSTGATMDRATAAPAILYMINQKLYLNTYYQIMLSRYLAPGDMVTVASGTQTYTIPIEKLTAYVNTDSDVVTGEAPQGATVKVIPADDRYARREVVAEASGVFSAGNPFTYTNSFSCSESAKNEDFTPGEYGRAYLVREDGSEVFTSYGRSIHVNENENYVELYLFATRDLDWNTPPTRIATVTLTPKQGSPVTAAVTAAGLSGKTKVSLTDPTGQRALIRPGDSISASFSEGPNGLTRSVQLSFDSLALVTGSPDVDTNTLAGVGPRGWTGRATLTSLSTAKPSAIATGGTTAYSPIQFLTSGGSPIPLMRGYAGTVSFSDFGGRRVWVAWAATTYQVKITGKPAVGDATVCGKAPPGVTVRIRDATVETQNTIIGTGTADSSGGFCVTVSPLYKDEVLLAEVDGTYSQPVIVGSITLQLAAEWNLISVPRPLQDPSLDALFAQTPTVTKAYTMQDGAWVYANRGASGWSGQLTQIVDGKGYYVYASEPSILALNLKSGDPAAPSYSLLAGWSLIGYVSSASAKNVEDYLASLAGNWTTLFRYDATNGWEMAKPGGMGFLQVESGRGYWINLTAEGALKP